MSAERTPVLSLRGIEKEYRSGEVSTKVLHGIDLDVHEGELIAIVGPSGSGKSTLLNIIGCLDRPTTGHYTIAGHDVSELDIVQRARARSLFLGFVFQGFHLLPGTTALENVEMPLLYQGIPPEERRCRAIQALEEVGLKERLHHTPAQLSGGQQQRVAVARALVTEPTVLLADEPTGNLDSRTSEEVLGLFQRLHEERGLTIVIVTHDPEVARAANRVVTVKDGLIESDVAIPEAKRRRVKTAPLEGSLAHAASRSPAGVISPLGLVDMGLRLAVRSLVRAKTRSALTTLGILIGIAAVVTTTAIGAGTKERMEREMMSLGANMLVVMPQAPSTGGGARGMIGSADGLTAKDAEQIAREVPAVAHAAPTLQTQAQVVRGSANVSTSITGTTPSYLAVRSWEVAEGSGFSNEDMEQLAKVCLVGQTVRKELFKDESAVGRSIRVGRMPCTVIGVLAPKGQSGFGRDQDDVILVPLTTYRAHIARRSGDDVDSIMVAAVNADAMARAESGITALLRQRHRIQDGAEDDFRVRNLSEMMNALDAQRSAITLLLLVVASISLLVGGIGVMNIMLVSVTERTKEIGIRLAIGARPIDILAQFLLEAVVLAFLGGVAGLLLGGVASLILGKVTDYSASLQPTSAFIAVAISCGIGIVFGFFPARNAASLDPIASLRRE